MAREMKNSSVEWIGEIPADFCMVKLKHVCIILDQFRKPVTADQREQEGEILYDYYGASGVIDKINDYTIDDHVMLIGEDGANLKMRNLPLMYEVNGKAWINNHAHILKPRYNIDFYFLFYALEAIDINPYITGSAQPKLSQESVKNIWIPLPDKNVQKKISYRIKGACMELDNVLKKIRASIEEYKKLKQAIITQAVTKGVRGNREMKDSGIEWMGEIPKEWHMTKLKYLISSPLQYGASETGVDYIEELPRYIRITDITIDNKLKEDGKLSLEEATAMPYLLFDDDILFSRSGATVGKTFLYKAEYGRAAFAGYLIRASVDENKAVPKFVYYNTLSQNYDIWKNSMVTQATIQNIGAGKYSNYIIAMPLLEEQLEIVEYLDNKISEIDKIIQKKEQYLTEIENYKKSLIYEYVTGKKEVPEKYQA